jgi:hypothetical protein
LLFRLLWRVDEQAGNNDRVSALPALAPPGLWLLKVFSSKSLTGYIRARSAARHTPGIGGKSTGTSRRQLIEIFSTTVNRSALLKFNANGD